MKPMAYWRRLAVIAMLVVMAPLVAGPSLAQQGAQGWRALCVPGNEVEILVGNSWYRGAVAGPDVNGEPYCDVLNTSYAGHEMQFAMAPERMRAVQAPGVPGPPTGPAPIPGEPSQAAWRALCGPGNEIEILVGGAWYKGIVIGPDQFGEVSCNVLNTSYSGSELLFAMAPDRMRAVHPPTAAAPVSGGQQSPTLPALKATLAEIGEAYKDNLAAARQRFEERTVTLAGTLQSVGSDYVRLTDGPFGIAMCTFDEGHRAQLAHLTPGAQLIVQGDDSSWGWGTFQLTSCRVLSEQIPRSVVLPEQVQTQTEADGQPPLGRYVCRQYMTTIGWIDLTNATYLVGEVEGGYSFDPVSGYISWNGGAYAGWPARYEFSPAGAGHAHDENIIRMTDESGALKIDCFLVAD
ncbi:MAG: hypothetical protein CML24_09680 [Rhizobiales bacterium]|nr:hypothetical protein [Hyphomicrobiales bacterium]|tara:strand:+ start:1132 stop:2349 length:1218 start_codon:yes stop_codon:yes gene_type:complete